MKRRKKRRAEFGAVINRHIERFENSKGISIDTLRNAQRLIHEGRCRNAVAVIVEAAEAVGRMNSEQMALTKSNIIVKRHYPINSKTMRDVESINTALEKTRRLLQTSCKLQ